LPHRSVRVSAAPEVRVSRRRRRQAVHLTRAEAIEDVRRDDAPEVPDLGTPGAAGHVDEVLQRAASTVDGLLLVLANEDQRRRLARRVLLSRPSRVLRDVSRHRHQVLSPALWGAGIAASVVAGLSTLFGP